MPPDVELIALCAKGIAAHRGGFPGAGDGYDADDDGAGAARAVQDVAKKMRRMRATTLSGVQAKARVILACWEGEATEEAEIVLSVLRDLVRLKGAGA